MKIKYTLLLLALMLLGFKCNRQPKNTDEVVAAFLNYVKDGDYDNARSLRCKVLRTDTLRENHDMKRLHSLLTDHGIPAKDKWKISYDTTGDILKTKMYSIEIYKEFNSNRHKNEGAVLDFTFDYSRIHIGDSIMNLNLHSLWLDNN